MISVVIPALNEEASIAECIRSVQENELPCELWVVDGGSTDSTRSIAAASGATVIEAPIRQRAAQLNIGASQATGDVLLFLHADTILPRSAFGCIRFALQHPYTGGGGFTRRFDSSSPVLRVTCWMAEMRNRAVGWHLGDQAMFVRRDLFEQLGGFREMDRFEDLDFSRRLGRLTHLATIRPPVVTSARRFAKDGPLKRTVKDLLLTLSYLRDELPEHGGAVRKISSHIAKT